MVGQSLSVVLVLSAPTPPPDLCSAILDADLGGSLAQHAVQQMAEHEELAMPAAIVSLENRPGHRPTTELLLEIMATFGSARTHKAIRPYLFSADPELAALATRALSLAAGARGVAALEHLVIQNRSFEQTLAALEGINDLGLPSSFHILQSFAENPDRDPVLRAVAVRGMPGIDRKKAKKWLKKAARKAQNPFFVNQIEISQLSMAAAEEARKASKKSKKR